MFTVNNLCSEVFSVTVSERRFLFFVSVLNSCVFVSARKNFSENVRHSDILPPPPPRPAPPPPGLKTIKID